MTKTKKHKILDILKALPDDTKEIDMSCIKLKSLKYFEKALKRFTELEKFDCSCNNLKEFDLNLSIFPKLLNLNFCSNNITKMPEFSETNTNVLTNINCSGNKITTLEYSKCIYFNSLLVLRCRNNLLENLPNNFDKIYPNLVELKCDRNSLRKLPKLPNTLEYLSIHRNKLDELPNELPERLNFLDCSYNKLSELPEEIFKHGLHYLNCSGNDNIKVIPSIPSKIIIEMIKEKKEEGEEEEGEELQIEPYTRPQQPQLFIALYYTKAVEYYNIKNWITYTINNNMHVLFIIINKKNNEVLYEKVKEKMEKINKDDILVKTATIWRNHPKYIKMYFEQNRTLEDIYESFV